MMNEDTEISLLERGEIEEKSYKWGKSAELYEQAAKALVEKKLLEDAAKIYNKSGDIYFRAVSASETKEKFLERKKNSIEAYHKAENLFKQIDNELLSLECEAKALFALGFAPISIEKGRNALKKSLDIYQNLNKIYSDRGDNKNNINISVLTLKSIAFLLTLSKEPSEFEYYLHTSRDLIEKAWILLKENDNLNFRVDLLNWENIIIAWNRYSELTYGDKREEEIRKKFLLKCKETLDLTRDCDDFNILGSVYTSVGAHYCFYGTLYAEERKERLELVEKGFDLLEKGINICRTIKDNPSLILTIYVLDYLAGVFGRFEYYQKRIFRDVHELQKLSKITDGLHTYHGLLTSRLSLMYYHNFAGRSFLKDDVRKSYAKLGIELAIKQLDDLTFGPFFALTYQLLTHFYSYLVILATEDEPQEEYIQKMFYYADLAENAAKGYKGGNVRSAGFDSLYRANRTMADIIKDKEEKIKHLKTAIESQRSNIRYAVESESVYFAAQIRLGLLYEELGILITEEKPLMEARELFLRVIKEASEKGYFYYTAACYEYIARLEDRLGNYNVSSECYEKAQNAHKNSLKAIEYKYLKEKVNEKIDYANAWSLIEKAKANHRKENHLDAKNQYEKACDILTGLPSYNHEGAYFSSWAILEEAEQLSKEERLEEAIDKYETAKDLFDTATMAIRFFRKNVKKLKELKKLEKVAKMRINYCTARVNLEKARILTKKGDHIEAAERFATAASQFKNICNLFKIKREQGELAAVYHLCKAWENMELAEKTENPIKYANSAKLFLKASELFIESKLKFLALGNSNFSLALEVGSNFDKSNELEVKANLYLKVKSNLRNASVSYEKGGFKNAADWALATSTYFDATWHLIQADNELKIDRRKELLDIGVSYLKSAAEFFSKAGHKSKEKEVLERIKRVNKEEKILISALNTITKPSISSSIEGIVAPSCPIETSQSPRIGEIQQYSEEVSTFLEKDSMKTIIPENIKLFISYATTDSSYFQVSKIASLLEEKPEIEKVLYWEEDLHDDIYDYMNKNLANCDAFLLFCSENANQSEPVQMEWKSALKIKKKIIPIFIKESDIPPLISTKLGVQFIQDDIEKTTDRIYQLVLRKLEI